MGLAYNILTPAKRLPRPSNAVKIGNAAAERVIEILDTKNPLETQRLPLNSKLLKRNLFKNISFKYDDEYVLKKLFFDHS